MSATTILGRGRAGGKVILFGEHAVVYGRPALAVPVTQVWAEATVEPAAPGTGIVIIAADLGETVPLRAAAADHPLATAVRLALAELEARRQRPGAWENASGSKGQPAGGQPVTEPDWQIIIRSTIPVASGLGSGAAVSAAIMRAVADAARAAPQSGGFEAFAGGTHGPKTPAEAAHGVLTAAELSLLVYEVEKLHHGTPSGIDNTVIAYEQPVYFVRGQAPTPFAIGRPFTLVIADTGIRSPTRIAVGDVRASWQAAQARFEALFDRVAAIVEAARSAIAAGEPERLGPLMDANHALLQEIGVSCPELDTLVAAARAAGALGAKLSGGGRGGNMIALVAAEVAARVAEALVSAGATRAIVTEVDKA